MMRVGGEKERRMSKKEERGERQEGGIRQHQVLKEEKTGYFLLDGVTFKVRKKKRRGEKDRKKRKKGREKERKDEEQKKGK